MKFFYSVWFVFAIMVLCVANVSAKRRKHEHRRWNHRHSSTAQPPPHLSIDAFGNCHTNNGAQLYGRCLRYPDCPSAVRAWHERQIQPLTCYYTTYENFVCCPDVGPSMHPAHAPPPSPPLFPTLESYLPLQPPPTAPSAIPTNSQLPPFQLRIGEIKEKRLSQEECSYMYFPSPHRRKRHRSKRQAESSVAAEGNDKENDKDYAKADAKQDAQANAKDDAKNGAKQDAKADAQADGKNDTKNDAKDDAKDDNKDDAVEEYVGKNQQFHTQAVGGVPTYKHEFPYMCALGWKSAGAGSDSNSLRRINYNCGCVLIARKYVLTAAHCASLGGEPPAVVRLGGVDLDMRRAEVISIKRITVHPAYDKELAYDDIAVIKLEKSSREQPACLWSSESLPQQQLTAVGYGQTKFAGPSSNNLLKVFLNVLSNQDCNQFYQSEANLRNGIGAGQICAGDPQGKMDTCQGDSGGPLLMTTYQDGTEVPYIVGLTSFGEGCANGTPSVYTRISNYLDWIEGIVWK